jgi:FKBP-type peptidyl-prolyl cis-trans isomerase FkpA
MKKNNQLLVAALGLFLASCGTGVKKTPGGVEYIIHKSGSGAQLKLGDTVLMNVSQHLDPKDSLLGESRKLVGRPVPVVLTAPKEKYDLMEGLALLKEGDSASFYIPIDSLPQHLPFGKKGDKLKITFAVVAKYSAAKQKTEEEGVIKSYLEKNNLKATPTAEGVYVAVSQEGAGELPKPGDTVYVHYTGKTLDGKVFDSSLDSTLRPGMKLEPIKFPIGRGFVIKGWDEGLSTLKKGSKATLVIPSGLAYGLQGSPPAIPSNAVLVFEVQLVDIKAGGAAPAISLPDMAPPAGKH